ncbi:MAG: arginine--tRNA ligase [Syntrophobacteraceae bacterium]
MSDLVRNRIIEMLSNAISPLLGSLDQAQIPPINIELDVPKLAQHGDYATNIALSLTRLLKRNPRDIASQIVSNLNDAEQLTSQVEIAGPGFINFFIHPDVWRSVLSGILKQREMYGRLDFGNGKRVQVEFVSANPTGPLHVGHGRGAAIGDVVANILRACGYDVDREYYINDAGNQMNTLGRSLFYRYQQLSGKTVEFPEGHYQGDYMRDLARELQEEVGDRYLAAPIDEVTPFFTRFAADKILAEIMADLADFGVTFNRCFSEQSLHDRDEIRKTILELENRGYVYELDGAKWFKSTAFGDEKDRVVIRANGISTYFAADLAYHKNKFERGFTKVIDVWGADHHGYVERMLAGVEALGRNRPDLGIILVQLVNLLRGGMPVAMSTRSGEFVTLREVIDEVGKDAARFIFLMRRTDSPLDFDLDVAKMQSNDNPVFYVQYAHARLCSIFGMAEERGISIDWSENEYERTIKGLVLPEEFALIKLMGGYPEVVSNAAKMMEPHFIPYFLHELVSLFHSYYNHHRILSDDPELTKARLYLAAAVRQVLRNALGLLGVAAPEKM